MNKLVGLVAVLGLSCGGSHPASPDAAKQVDAAMKMDAPAKMDASIDAPPPFDFSCIGSDSGSGSGSAAAAITISGTTETISSTGALSPLSGVVLALLAGSNNVQLATTGPTGSDGAWTFGSNATGGSALDVYVSASEDGQRTSFVYPPRPLLADELAVPVVMLTNAQLAQIAQFGGPTQGSGLGFMVVEVADCKGARVSGATLAIDQGSSALPPGNTIDVGSLLSALAGVYVVFNVPPGVASVGATFGSATLPSHDVTSFADADTETQVLP